MFIDSECLKSIADLSKAKYEPSNRALTYEIIDELISGKYERLNEIPIHSCSLLNYSQHDKERFQSFVSLKNEKKFLDYDVNYRSLHQHYTISFLLQMYRYKEAFELLCKIKEERELNLIEIFFLFKTSTYLGATIPYYSSLVHQLYQKVPDNAALKEELIFACMSSNIDTKFIDIASSREVLLRKLIENLTSRFSVDDKPKSQIGGLNFKRPNSVFGVLGMRCSGGSAIQDYLINSSTIKSSAGEYVALSGIFGYLHVVNNGYRLDSIIRFLQFHLFGSVVPASRNESRVLRQAISDRNNNYDIPIMESLIELIPASDSLEDFAEAILPTVWSIYEEPDKALMLKKVFSSGRFELLEKFSFINGVMVWRDPRSQYVDQIERGFTSKGDVKGFITELESKISGYARGLAAALKSNPNLKIVNVKFEDFITNRTERAYVLNCLGAEIDQRAERLFDFERSQKNIDYWVGKISVQEEELIVNSLGFLFNVREIDSHIERLVS